jgi:hypothetical protein
VTRKHEPDRRDIERARERLRHVELAELRRRLDEGGVTEAERAAIRELLEEGDKVTPLPAANEGPPDAA